MTSIHLKPVRGDREGDGRRLETHQWGNQPTGAGLEVPERCYNARGGGGGVELLSLTLLFLGVKGRACLKLIGSTC